VSSDLAIAFNLLQKAAAKNHSYAQYNLAVYYGWPQTKWCNPELAFDLYQKAADQGHTGAMNNLGFQYHNGGVVTRNLETAYTWYLKAANHGHEIAQHNIGNMYHYGNGIEFKKDVKTAVDWYRKSANQGYASAQRILGNLYYGGGEIPQNYSLAFYYHILAAEQGDTSSNSFLISSDNSERLYTYLSNEWPGTHAKLHQNCKNMILEVLFIMGKRFQEEPLFIPNELCWVICKLIVRVWPDEERHLPFLNKKI